MEKVRTVEEIKKSVQDEKSNEQNLIKQEIIKKLEKTIRRAVRYEEYIKELDLNAVERRNYSLEYIKEVCESMNCSILKFKRKLYLCVDKIPRTELVLKYYAKKFTDRIIPLLCIIGAPFVIWTVFDIEVIRNMIMIMDIIVSIPIVIESVNIKLIKKIEYEDGIYILKK